MLMPILMLILVLKLEQANEVKLNSKVSVTLSPPLVSMAMFNPSPRDCSATIRVRRPPLPDRARAARFQT